MSNKIKDFIISGFLALSKAEQAMVKSTIMNNDNISMDQQVRKEEIKILSKRRFYDLVESADEIQRKKYEARNRFLMEERGMENVIKSFKNSRYGDFWEGTTTGGVADEDVKYKFKTTNALYKFADSAHVVNLGNSVEISFLINTHDHPIVRTNLDVLSQLEYFEVLETVRTYAYRIKRYLGSIIPNQNEVLLKFEAIVEKDGVCEIDMDDKVRTMTKKDLIKPFDTVQYYG